LHQFLAFLAPTQSILSLLCLLQNNIDNAVAVSIVIDEVKNQNRMVGGYWMDDRVDFLRLPVETIESK
jgi:hypothetical protein